MTETITKKAGRPIKYDSDVDKILASKKASKKYYEKHQEELKRKMIERQRAKKPVVLSECQKNARNHISTFSSTDNLFFLLEGGAGTGKTFVLVDYVIDNIYSYEHVYFIAPTNKAVRVLREKIYNKMSDSIGSKKFTCLTLDKYLGSIERIDDSHPKKVSYFAPEGLIRINGKLVSESCRKCTSKITIDEECKCKYFRFKSDNGNNLIVFDECSMLNDDRWNLIKKFNSSKMVLLGDKNQLPPIDNPKDETGQTKESEVFDDPIITDESKYTLIEILRSNNAQIAGLYATTLNFVLDEDYSKITKPNIYKELKKSKVYITAVIDNIKRELVEDIKNNVNFVILSNMNNSVKKYENIVKVVLNETKICKHGYYLNTKYVISKYFTQDLHNMAEFEILDVIPTDDLTEEKLSGFKLIVKLSGNNKETVIYVLNQEDYEIWKCKRQDIIDFLSKDYKLPSRKEEQIKLIELYHQKDSQIKEKYSNKREGAIIYLKKEINLFMKYRDESFTLSHSLTVHKSQGSSYRKVYVNINDIMFNTKSSLKDKARLIYVATSRASDNIVYYW